jgi:hypothetical protein
MTRRFIDDDDDILKDGQTLRVPMIMRDGAPNRDLTPLQLEIARASRQRDAQQNHMTVVDALGRSDQLHLRRPGARYAVHDAGSNEHAMQQTLRAMRDEAYRSVEAEASNAWKGSNREIAIPDGINIYDAYDIDISNRYKGGNR